MQNQADTLLSADFFPTVFHVLNKVRDYVHAFESRCWDMEAETSQWGKGQEN